MHKLYDAQDLWCVTVFLMWAANSNSDDRVDHKLFCLDKAESAGLTLYPSFVSEASGHSPNGLLQQPVAELHKYSFPMATYWDC